MCRGECRRGMDSASALIQNVIGQSVEARGADQTIPGLREPGVNCSRFVQNTRMGMFHISASTVMIVTVIGKKHPAGDVHSERSAWADRYRLFRLVLVS